MLNKEQLSAAGRAWYLHVNSLRDEPSEAAAAAGNGPYHLVAAVAETPGTLRARQARDALRPFTVAAIPNMCPLTRKLLTGKITLHVLPQRVYNETAWRVLVDTSLGGGPFTDPPTEADLAETLIRALTVPPRHDHQILALRGACEHLGWRAVADLINAMDEGTRKSLPDVVAILGALTAEPAPAG